MSASPFEASKNIQQFRERLAAYRRAGGGEELVWQLFEDLGKQVSDVRHEISAVRQDIALTDARLFGHDDGRDPELMKGGMLGILTRKIEESARYTNNTIQARTAEQTGELQANQRWIKSVLGGLGGLGISVVVYFIAHVAGWVH